MGSLASPDRVTSHQASFCLLKQLAIRDLINTVYLVCKLSVAITEKNIGAFLSGPSNALRIVVMKVL